MEAEDAPKKKVVKKVVKKQAPADGPKKVVKKVAPTKIAQEPKKVVVKTVKKPAVVVANLSDVKMERPAAVSLEYSPKTVQRVLRCGGVIGGLRAKGVHETMREFLSRVTRSIVKRAAIICMMEKRSNVHVDALRLIEFAHAPGVRYVMSRRKPAKRVAPKPNAEEAADAQTDE